MWIEGKPTNELIQLVSKMKSSTWLSRTLVNMPLGAARISAIEKTIAERQASVVHLDAITIMEATCQNSSFQERLQNGPAAELINDLSSLSKGMADLEAHAPKSFMESTEVVARLSAISSSIEKGIGQIIKCQLLDFSHGLTAAYTPILEAKTLDADADAAIDSEKIGKLISEFEVAVVGLTARSAQDIGLAKFATAKDLQAWKAHAVVRGAFLSNISPASKAIVKMKMKIPDDAITAGALKKKNKYKYK